MKNVILATIEWACLMLGAICALACIITGMLCWAAGLPAYIAFGIILYSTFVLYVIFKCVAQLERSMKNNDT